VECFFKNLFGEIKVEELSNLLGPNLRNGLVNATHVIGALRNFPYEAVFGSEEFKILKSEMVIVMNLILLNKSCYVHYSSDRQCLRCRLVILVWTCG
jgi:hypothetical protein